MNSFASDKTGTSALLEQLTLDWDQTP